MISALFQGRSKLGAIYTFSTGNGGLTGDSCAYNGYVNSIYTVAISGVNKDGSLPNYAEECPAIMASTLSLQTWNKQGKIVSKIHLSYLWLENPYFNTLK